MNTREHGKRAGIERRDLRELVDSSAEAGYVTARNGAVIAWNAAAARLLGYEERQVVGLHCWQVLRGLDVYGNAQCGPRCPVVQMLARGEPVHDFALRLRSTTGERVCVRVTAVGIPLQSGERVVLHLLHPCRCEKPTVQNASDANERDDGAAALCSLGLSAREIQVLRLLGDGARTADIAHLLFISTFTVRTHVQRILSKLGAHSKLEAVAFARRAGLL